MDREDVSGIDFTSEYYGTEVVSAGGWDAPEASDEEPRQSIADDLPSCPTLFGSVLKGRLWDKYGRDLGAMSPREVMTHARLAMPFARWSESSWRGWLNGTLVPSSPRSKSELSEYLGINVNELEQDIKGSKLEPLTSSRRR